MTSATATGSRRAVTPRPPVRTSVKPGTRSDARKAMWLRIAFLVFALALWQVLVVTGVLNERFVSSPIAVLQAIPQLAVDPQAIRAVGETLAAFAAAFAIGTSLGIVVGVVFGLNSLLREAYYPLIMLLMVVPKSVFLPLLVLFFGLGTAPGIAFGALLAFVHVVVNVVAGMDLVPQKYRDVGRAYNASSTRLFFDVILPGAAPGIFAGLWHGIRNGFIGVVIAQLFVSTAGIGYLVRIYSNNFQIDDAMALTLVMAALVILTGSVWSRLEARLTRWRQ